jgi:hypothetical protein
MQRRVTASAAQQCVGRGGALQVTVARRYSEFEELKEAMAANGVTAVKNLSFPSGMAMMNLFKSEASRIEERRSGLEE